jgi:predicted RNA-binding Zn-ribbon protein involved in translation (DUF1610 family)
MPDLYITCETTNQPVHTGVGMDEADFEAFDIEGREFGCPACGQTHVWTKDEAFFQS